MPREYEIVLELNPKGAEKIFEVTSKNIGRRMCVIINGELVLAHVIHEPIYNTCSVKGSFSSEEAYLMARRINKDLE